VGTANQRRLAPESSEYEVKSSFWKLEYCATTLSVFGSRRFHSQPKEKSDGHENAATSDPRTFPFPNSSALPKCTQEARLILVQNRGRNASNIGASADKQQDNDK